MTDSREAEKHRLETARTTAITALVPLNRLTVAKSRLRGVLSAEDRAALVMWLAGQVLAALHDSGTLERIVVVSPDSRTLACLGDADPDNAARIVPLLAAGGSLNADLEQGRVWAQEHGAQALLVALADLPLLTGEAVRRLLAMAQLEPPVGEGAVILARDRAGRGTNLMLARPEDAIPFAFGQGSLARHIELARAAGVEPYVFESEETSFDVDTPADLHELIARDLWTPSDTSRQAVAG